MDKKTITLIIFNLLTSTAIAATGSATSSKVILTGSGPVTPGSHMDISLTGLIPNAKYSINCTIATLFTDEIVRLTTNANTSSGDAVQYFKINESYSDQGQLKQGNNTVSVSANFTTPGSGIFTITNLDQDNSITISNCYAVAIG